MILLLYIIGGSLLGRVFHRIHNFDENTAKQPKMCCGGINPTRNIIAIQQGAIMENATVVKGYLVT